MKRNPETGHIKNVSSFQLLKTKCASFGSQYKPSNPAIKLPGLNTKWNEADASQDMVNDLLANRQKTSNLRFYEFDDLDKYASRVVNSLSASGASDQTMDDAMFLLRKIQGRRATAIEPPKTPAPGETAKQPKHKSASQAGFDNKVEFFSRLIILVSKEELYVPDEEDLRVDALTKKLDAMKKANSNPMDSITELENARNKRNVVLYHPGTGLVKRAALVKDYVMSVYGAGSQEFKDVNAIPFRTLVKL